MVAEEHGQAIEHIKQNLSQLVHTLDSSPKPTKKCKKVNNFEQKTEIELKHKSLIKQHFNSRNLPIAKLLTTTERITHNHKKINKKLNKMLDRLDLDRPLLFKEKLQTVWGVG